MPEAAIDTVKVLRRIGYKVEYPEEQTCCGQPAFNTGYWDEARPCAERFVRVFKDADLIVCPSGSCTTMVRTFYPELLAASSWRADAIALASRTFELSEFLVKVAAVTQSAQLFRTRLPITRPATGCANCTFMTNRSSFCARWMD